MLQAPLLALWLAALAVQGQAQTLPPAAPAAAVVPLLGESLPDLLRRVLPADPAVRSAQAQLEITAERRIQARSRLGPTAGLSANYGRSADQEASFDVLGQRIVSPVARVNTRSEATLRWNLYNGGNDAAELRATTVEERAALQDLRRAQEEAAQRISDAYVDVLRLQTVLPRAADRTAAVQRLVELTRRQADLGKMSDSDAQQAEAALLDAEMAQEEAAADLESARRKLARLIGAMSVDEIRPAVAVVLPKRAGDGSAVPGTLAAAQERARAARERVRPQLSLLAPRIDLEVRKALGDHTNPALTTQTDHAWQVTARWDLPLGGELQSRRDEVERRAEAAEAEAERIARGLSAELSTLEPQVAQAERALSMIVRQIDQYTALVRAGELQFEAGRRTLTQLIALRDSRYNAEKRLAEQAARLQRARISQLYYSGEILAAMGIGPLDRLSPYPLPLGTVPPPVDELNPGGM